MLDWGKEYCATAQSAGTDWHHPSTNHSLDFHGDPVTADLVVYSDGNHHMALADAICAFRERHNLRDIFYTTTPPGPLMAAMNNGGIRLGNLLLSRMPHVFISPYFVLEDLRKKRLAGPIRPLFSSRGNVLLVRRGNPLGIRGIADLVRADVRLFVSNPETEKASYRVYRDTLDGLARMQGLDLSDLFAGTDSRIVYGQRIHHREAPMAVASGEADCAVLYYHLALRYTRLFPEHFAIVTLSASQDEGEAAQANIVSCSGISLVADGGQWGAIFVDFMESAEVRDIYRHHGMDPSLN